MTKRALVALTLVMVGCSTSSSTTAPHTGTLSVTVTAPAGLATSVTITGPGGYAKTITSTTTFTGVAPGSYAITAVDVATSDPIVSSVYHATITGSPAVVGVGTQASATATFAARTGSGALWLVGGSDTGANILNTAMSYTSAQLHTSSSTSPTVKMNFPITTGHNIDASGVAFDAQGNLWVVNDNSNTVVEYTASQLGTSGDAAPAVTIQLAAMSDCYAIAFDSTGNLWVGNNLANNIVEFTASQLTASGSPTPAVTIAEVPVSGNIQEPIGLAFDKHGNLWVANNASSTIVEYTRNQLASSGSPAPAVTLSGAAILEPNEIAFDPAGNLWITNSAYYFKPDSTAPDAAGRIVEYAASSLTASGSPTPLVTLNLPMVGQYTPLVTGIAFDDSGNLWFADVWSQYVGEYTVAQLSASGTPTPATMIASSSGVGGVGIAFNPHTTAVPLH